MANVGNGKVKTQPEKIDHILTGACEYFGFSMEQLQETTGTKSKIWDRKRYLIPILSNHTICNSQDIADRLGYKTKFSVIRHAKTMKEELSGKLYGSEKTKMIYNELLSYLNL